MLRLSDGATSKHAVQYTLLILSLKNKKVNLQYLVKTDINFVPIIVLGQWKYWELATSTEFPRIFQKQFFRNEKKYFRNS